MGRQGGAEFLKSGGVVGWNVLSGNVTGESVLSQGECLLCTT